MTEPELDIKTRILLEAQRSFLHSRGMTGLVCVKYCDEAGANVSLVSYHFGAKKKVFRHYSNISSLII